MSAMAGFISVNSRIPGQPLAVEGGSGVPQCWMEVVFGAVDKTIIWTSGSTATTGDRNPGTEKNNAFGTTGWIPVVGKWR